MRVLFFYFFFLVGFVLLHESLQAKLSLVEHVVCSWVFFSLLKAVNKLVRNIALRGIKQRILIYILNSIFV